MDDGSKKNCENQKNGCTGNSTMCCGMPVQQLIRGVLAVCLGLLFLGFAYRVIIRIVIFGLGLGLMYYGLRVLGVTQVTTKIDGLVARIKRLFNC